VPGNAQTGVKSAQNHFSGNATYRESAQLLGSISVGVSLVCLGHPTSGQGDLRLTREGGGRMVVCKDRVEIANSRYIPRSSF
jgi:hypothetical protein